MASPFSGIVRFFSFFFHLTSSHFIHLGGGGSPSATAVTTIRKGPMLQWRSHPNLTSYCKSDKSQCKTSPSLYPTDYPIEEELLGEGGGGVYQSDSCDDWRTDRKTVFIKAESQYDLT